MQNSYYLFNDKFSKWQNIEVIKNNNTNRVESCFILLLFSHINFSVSKAY